MKIVCDSCGAKYSIADEKVAGKIFKIRCKKCSSVLEVRGDQTGADAVDQPLATPARGSEPTWYIVIDGEQKGPLAPIELSRLFAKGSVGLDSYVWNEGFEDWKIAGEVPELAQIFGAAASQAGRPQAVADDTEAFARRGDLFGANEGREPTSEIDTNSSMFAGFEESPTPTPSGAERSPFAAASQDAGTSVGGGAMGMSAPQRMTGQRNENSVLFSLSNLQQLASRGGSPAQSATVASQRPAASLNAQGLASTSGDGSGLIDIRALAKSTTPGTSAAPSQAVDDLLAIGTGAGAAFGAPLLGPAPDESSDRNRWLWIGGVAIAVIAIVGAGVGVGMAIGGSDEDALEITAEAQPTPAHAIPGSKQAAVAAQSPIEPADEALAAREPIEAATIEDNTPEPAPELVEPAPKKPSTASSKSERRPRASRTKDRATPEPEPAPKKRGGNLDALMDEVVGGSSSKPAETKTSSGSAESSLPDAPSRDDVKTALQGVSGAVKACGKSDGGTATVNVTFSGKTGRVSNANVASGPFKGTPVGSCIEAAVKRARVPRFKQSTFKVTFPYRL